MQKTYVLTGGTGFLGSRLALSLLDRGDHVIFLVRAKNSVPAQDRLRGVLAALTTESHLLSFDVWECDLARVDLGLSEEQRVILEETPIDGFWHIAANVSFKKVDAQDVFRSNVESLHNVLAFTKGYDMPFFYMSTAYVHGARSGTLYESELIEPSAFNNPYERSKYLAEKYIHEHAGNNFIIFRPGILIERNTRTLNFSGYYIMVLSLYKLRKNLLSFYEKHHFLASLSGMRMKHGVLHLPFPFVYSKKGRLGLLPMGVAVPWMVALADTPRARGKTFHIVNTNPFWVKRILDETFTELKVKLPLIRTGKYGMVIYFYFLRGLGTIVPVLRSLSRKLGYYRYYLSEPVVHDIRQTQEILIGTKYTSMETFQFAPGFLQKTARTFLKVLNTK